jgi:hypothetical protein
VITAVEYDLVDQIHYGHVPGRFGDDEMIISQDSDMSDPLYSSFFLLGLVLFRTGPTKIWLSRIATAKYNIGNELRQRQQPEEMHHLDAFHGNSQLGNHDGSAEVIIRFSV